jgi:uncharacterized membrane-anchored protein
LSLYFQSNSESDRSLIHHTIKNIINKFKKLTSSQFPHNFILIYIHMTQTAKDILIKVPAVTLGFWIIKILCTTLGETGGDAVSMTWNLGYLVSTGIFAFILVGLIIAQVKSKTYKPWLYWATIIASTTAGTTLADFATRSLGIGLSGRCIIGLSHQLQ